MCEIRVVQAKRKIRSLPHGDYFCLLRDSKVKTVLRLITGGVCGIHTHKFLQKQEFRVAKCVEWWIWFWDTLLRWYSQLWVQDKYRKNILEKLPKLTAAKCDFLLNKERLWKIIKTSLQASDQSKSQVYKKKTAFHPEMHQGSELKHRVLSCLPAFLLTHFVMWVRLCLQGHRSYNASHWANSSNQAWALSTHEQQSKKV